MSHAEEERDPERIKIEIYKGRKRLRQALRWRAVAPNGRIIATGAEAYTNHDDIREVVDTLFANSGTEFIIEDDT